jgi:predicted nucleic acid-binding protein
MKVYLDTCSLHRPVDNKAELRVAMESEAILGILALAEVQALTLVSSEVLAFEVDQNPHPQRKAFVSAVLDRAQVVVPLTDAIEHRAEVLVQRGFKPLDALHLACAEAEGVDYFCSCDDRLLNRAHEQRDLSVKVVSPLELAKELLR